MCKFEFDPDLWDDAGEHITEPWKCPYPTVGGTDFCAFHLLPSQRLVVFSSPAEVQQAYEKAVASVNGLYLIGTSVGQIDLSRFLPYLEGEGSLQIGFSWIKTFKIQDEELSPDLVVVHSNIRDLQANDSRFKGQVRIRNSDIGISNFASATIEGRSVFEGNSIHSARFTDASFLDTVSFNERVPEGTDPEKLDEYQGENPSTFNQTALFYGVTFERLADYSGVTFCEGASFFEAKFQGGAAFSETEFEPGVQFDAAEFLNGTDFSDSKLGNAGFQNAIFRERTIFEDVDFGYTPLDDEMVSENDWPGVYKQFLKRTQEISADFGGCEATEEFLITNANSKTGILMINSKFENLNANISIDDDMSIVTLKNGQISNGKISLDSSHSPIYEFSNATVGEIDLEHEEEANIFDYIFFSNTEFDGFDFTKYREAFEQNNWIIDEVRTHEGVSTSNRREITYAKAKSGATTIGDSYAASQFFVKELRFRRKRHWQRATQTSSYQIKVKNSLRWLFNLAFDLTCKYAESSGRVVILSMISILSFGLIYRYFGLHLPYSTSVKIPFGIETISMDLGFLVFSIQSFTAFLLDGGAQVEDAFIRLTASVESFIGAFLIGLFVATVVRSVER